MPDSTDYRIRRAHGLIMSGRFVHEIERELGIPRKRLRREFARLGLAPTPRKYRNGFGNDRGSWVVTGPHQHVLAEGTCLLCDRRIQ